MKQKYSLSLTTKQNIINAKIEGDFAQSEFDLLCKEVIGFKEQYKAQLELSNIFNNMKSEEELIAKEEELIAKEKALAAEQSSVVEEVVEKVNKKIEELKIIFRVATNELLDSACDALGIMLGYNTIKPDGTRSSDISAKELSVDKNKLIPVVIEYLKKEFQEGDNVFALDLKFYDDKSSIIKSVNITKFDNIEQILIDELEQLDLASIKQITIK